MTFTDLERHGQIEDCFSFEKQKHDAFYRPWYSSNGYTVVADNVQAGVKSPWDVRVERDGRSWTVDEKAVRNVWNAMCIEMMQDVGTGNLGWVYHDNDAVLFGMWADRNAALPGKLYWVRARMLLPYVIRHWNHLPKRLDSSGWGETFFVLADWDDLSRADVAVWLPVE